MSAIVRMVGMSKTYRMGEVEVKALKPMDLELGEGEVTVVVGPSGSGKTTLLNLIGGLDRPTEGTITVAGIEINRLDNGGLTSYRREKVGFIFQFFNLIPSLTALENVEFVAGLVKESLDPRQVLETVGLGNRADHFPAELSGGEQQRVAIARALVKDPLLLLADEPTGALDVDTGVRVLALLREAAAKRGKSVVIVTHNSAVAKMADRIIRLRDGEVISDERIESPVDPLEIRW